MILNFDRSIILFDLFALGFILFPKNIPIRFTPNHGNIGK